MGLCLGCVNRSCHKYCEKQQRKYRWLSILGFFMNKRRGAQDMRAKNIHLDAHRQEITRKIPGFPVSCYCTTFRSDTYDYIDWHWHVEFQLCLTVSGSVLWHTEAEQTEVPAGQGIFINSQRVHMVRPVRKEASFFCLDIPPDFICPPEMAVSTNTVFFPYSRHRLFTGNSSRRKQKRAEKFSGS